MERMRRWMPSGLIPPLRRRADAHHVSAVLGAGIVVGLIVGAGMGARPLRSRLRAVPAGLGRASGLFGRLVMSARRAVDGGSSVVLTDEDTATDVKPKAPAANSPAREQALTGV